MHGNGNQGTQIHGLLTKWEGQDAGYCRAKFSKKKKEAKIQAH